MQKVLYGFLAALVLVACNKEEEKGETAQAPAPSAIEAATASGAASAPVTYTTSPAQQVPAAGTPAAGTPVGVKLNPPHGEPGHLCEIAVGAPLPPQGVLPAPVEMGPERPTPIDPGPTSIINRPLNTVVFNGPKPKFNPAHGQPWHTCDLEVGAPLN
ncbi:MAG: hypothetical protein KF870_08960 [Leadbetterella sp.]|nr:hypothetical protein [Leadbetterella sp.]